MIKRYPRALIGIALVVAVAVLACLVLGGGEPPEAPDDFNPERHLWPQEPTTAFPIKSVPDAWDEFKADELILGVTVGPESRAYPLNSMGERPGLKVINDVVGGRPIAATWCNAAFNALVYSRELDGQTLTLGIAGQLWRRSMVMFDLETGTRWSNLQGLGKLGPLTGQRLKLIPSVLTDWDSWRRLHPKGTVALLGAEEQTYRREFYQKEPDRFVLAITEEGQSRHWGLADLQQTPVLNDDWVGRPVVVVLHQPSVTARLYERTVQGRTLTFEPSGAGMTDRETGSIWEPIEGRAVSGPLTGQRLTPLPALLSYRSVWLSFYPRSR